jgi:putative chitinase
MITLEQLQQLCITQAGKARCAAYLPHLLTHAPAYGINTPRRLAAFLGQVMHESAEFRHVRELGGDKYLAKYDTGKLAKRLGNTPAADGDGQRFRGRGLIQITGATNYRACGEALGIDLLSHPELLEEPEYAVQSACWYWWDKGLSLWADINDFRTITRKINGGDNGHADRVAYWERATRVIGQAPDEEVA